MYCLQLSFSAEKQPDWVSREEIFTNWQIGDVVFWNKNSILKFWENVKIASSMNILHSDEVDINWKHLKHVQQRVQFFPIISVWEFQKLKLNYLENVLMKFRENLGMWIATMTCLRDSHFQLKNR